MGRRKKKRIRKSIFQIIKTLKKNTKYIKIFSENTKIIHIKLISYQGDSVTFSFHSTHCIDSRDNKEITWNFVKRELIRMLDIDLGIIVYNQAVFYYNLCNV